MGFEKNFYTLNKHQDPYCWEKFYARNIEPLMGTLLSKIISKANIVVRNGYHIIDKEEKMQLAYIMVMQLFRGKQSRKYEEALFKKLLPDVFEKVRKNFGTLSSQQLALLDDFELDTYYFKQTSMEVTLDYERIIQYVNVLGWHKFIFLHLCGDKEFVTSDNPVMFLNISTSDARPFANGLLQKETAVYYPLSPKLLLWGVHPKAYFQEIIDLDESLVHLNETKEKRFIDFINRKQYEQCYNQVYASKEVTLNKI